MLGSHVAEALLERGYEVYGVVRPRSNVRNVAAFQSKVKMVTAELTDPWRVLRLVQKQKPDFIFHFAAQAFNSLSFEQPAETLHTNLMSASEYQEFSLGFPFNLCSLILKHPAQMVSTLIFFYYEGVFSLRVRSCRLIK